MRILEMTATFGKLDAATLRLKPGMNLICAPNEWGKSTWCAFLTAMFYGIDTRERSAKDGLADKEHFAPWSGKPMEGAIRLEFQGRDITIARRTRGRIPLGEFCAFETQTGLPIRELTADNCGQMLLGVEKSVFRRSGFITLKDMPVTQDEALRRRLNSLVTTADESGQADHLAQQLRELKNRCRYHRSGLIPKCREQLEELHAQLQQRQILDESLAQTLQQEKELTGQLEKLEQHRKWLDYRQTQLDAAGLTQAIEHDAAAQSRLAHWQTLCQAHPSREELEARLVIQESPPKRRKPGWVLLFFAVLVLGAAGALSLMDLWIAAGLLLIPAAILMTAGILTQRRYSRWEAQHQARIQQRETWVRQLQERSELERCRREAEQAREHLNTLRSMVRTGNEPPFDDPLDLTEVQTAQALDQTQEQLRHQRQLRGEALGRMEHLPQADAIRRQAEQTAHRFKELERTYLALGYAQKALEEAMGQLQRRFAPRILRRSREFLSRMTAGRYEELQLAQDLSMSARAADEITGRSGHWRSDGTVDQMYLALRLAVWEALMPVGPLVLDDALVRFDQQRLDAALELLQELSREHQVIVFTCR